jgi:peptide/nickel transport system ATP-binding protein
MNEPLLQVDGLSVEFQTPDGWRQVTYDVSFAVDRRKTLALVGESGSGKSVTAMSILDLLPPNARRTGRILFDGIDLVPLRDKGLRPLRGARIATIFQEPMTALNPVYTIGHQLIEALTSHQHLDHTVARERAVQLLRDVHMPDPEEKVDHYPHQLSGGQRQRAMIAMAISSEPDLLIADEPTTALDVTVQAEILDLIAEIQERMGMAVLIITHDMGVVADVADDVVVMKDGRVVEEAASARLFKSPQEPYTQALLAAVPHLGKADDFLSAARNKLRIDGVTAATPLPETIPVGGGVPDSRPSTASTSRSSGARSSASSANRGRASPRSARPRSACCR